MSAANLAWLMVGTLSGLLGGYYVLPWLIKPVLTRRLTQRVKEAGCVCLTFDDGPDPAATSRLLDVLDAAGAKGTFFLLGRNAKRHPELVRRMVESGHEIGEHGFGHCHAWTTEPFAYVQDLLHCRRALAEAAGARQVSLYRPAYGEMNLLTLFYVLIGRRRIILWNVNPRDFEAGSAEEVATRVAAAAQEGSVILLHDAREGATGDAQLTVEAVRRILQAFMERGLSVSTVSAALGAAPR